MKPHVALTALIATLIAVTVSHLEWVQADGGHLLMVDGRPLDAEGWLRNQLNSLRREFDFGAVPVRLTLRAPKNPFDRERT